MILYLPISFEAKVYMSGPFPSPHEGGEDRHGGKETKYSGDDTTGAARTRHLGARPLTPSSERNQQHIINQWQLIQSEKQLSAALPKWFDRIAEEKDQRKKDNIKNVGIFAFHAFSYFRIDFFLHVVAMYSAKEPREKLITTIGKTLNYHQFLADLLAIQSQLRKHMNDDELGELIRVVNNYYRKQHSNFFVEDPLTLVKEELHPQLKIMGQTIEGLIEEAILACDEHHSSLPDTARSTADQLNSASETAVKAIDYHIKVTSNSDPIEHIAPKLPSREKAPCESKQPIQASPEMAYIEKILNNRAFVHAEILNNRAFVHADYSEENISALSFDQTMLRNYLNSFTSRDALLADIRLKFARSYKKEDFLIIKRNLLLIWYQVKIAVAPNTCYVGSAEERLMVEYLFSENKFKDADINHHRNPGWDWLFGINHCATLQIKFCQIRLSILKRLLIKDLEAKENIAQKLDFLNRLNYKTTLFSYHTANFWFTGAFFRTEAQQVIDRKIDQIESEQAHSARTISK